MPSKYELSRSHKKRLNNATPEKPKAGPVAFEQAEIKRIDKNTIILKKKP